MSENKDQEIYKHNYLVDKESPPIDLEKAYNTPKIWKK